MLFHIFLVCCSIGHLPTTLTLDLIYILYKVLHIQNSYWSSLPSSIHPFLSSVLVSVSFSFYLNAQREPSIDWQLHSIHHCFLSPVKRLAVSSSIDIQFPSISLNVLHLPLLFLLFLFSPWSLFFISHFCLSAGFISLTSLIQLLWLQGPI